MSECINKDFGVYAAKLKVTLNASVVAISEGDQFTIQGIPHSISSQDVYIVLEVHTKDGQKVSKRVFHFYYLIRHEKCIWIDNDNDNEVLIYFKPVTHKKVWKRSVALNCEIPIHLQNQKHFEIFFAYEFLSCLC